MCVLCWYVCACVCVMYVCMCVCVCVCCVVCEWNGMEAKVFNRVRLVFHLDHAVFFMNLNTSLRQNHTFPSPASLTSHSRSPCSSRAARSGQPSEDETTLTHSRRVTRPRSRSHSFCTAATIVHHACAPYGSETAWQGAVLGAEPA